ncbi:MAG TPA: DNA internalization-related competence protein ComEC/Rec2 [Verrucomicrobiae bacterium]|nr:DNA internalization-related competence protein ComEC/Rec2 [Verrucomicrobiae bacterium]
MPTKAQPRAPLALAAIAFACGIWLTGHLQRPPMLWGWAAVTLALCAVVAVMARCLKAAQVSAVLALVCAGAFARVATPVTGVAVPPPKFLSGEVEIVAHVTNDGALLAGGGPRERFDLETEVIKQNGIQFAQPVGVRATVFSREIEEDAEGNEVPSLPHLAYGDRIRLTAKLHLPRNFRNPGAFDYESYLRGHGISTLASLKADSIEALPGAAGSRLGFWRSRMRNSILEHIRDRRLWTQDDAAIFSSMIVGDDSLLLRDVREEFQQTGVYHLLVVSGMNVALLAFAVFWLARRVRLPDWAASLVTIALSIFYAYIAGMGLPITRAVLMLSLFLVARLLYRDRSGMNATGFAALVVLVLFPAALFDAGFQLTFLALLAITGISLPLLERTTTPYRQALRHLDSTSYDLSLEPKLAQFRLDLRLVTGRVARIFNAKIFSARIFGTRSFGLKLARLIVIGPITAVIALYELGVVSAITQAVLVLPMRTYFHRAAILGLPANVLVLPLAGIMLNAGVAAIALSYISLPFARLAALVAAAALHWTLACLHALSHLPIAQWRMSDPAPFLLAVATAGILLALVTARRRRTMAFAGVALLFLSSVIAAVHHSPPRIEQAKLEVTAIDVGQGDSLLVVSPEGRTMLIDGGGSVGPVRSEFDFGEDVVAPYLWSRGLDRLDVVVLTHAHGDHIGGLPRIIEDFQPSELWVGINPQVPGLQRLYEAALASHVVIRSYVAGDAMDWGGANIRVLSPPADWVTKPKPRNDDSLAFLVRYGDTSALLAGDLPKNMERFVATESPGADLLKVTHHGSATSTTPEFLAAVHPRFAVISAGYRNSFGHPRQVVLERLQAGGIRTYRTDLLGGITFLLDGKQVQASTQSH